MEKDKKKKTEKNSESKILGARSGQSRFQLHIRKGLTTLLVVILSIAFYFLIDRAGVLSGYIKMVLNVMKPIIYGVIIAYLLNPLVNAIEKPVLRFLLKRMKKADGAKKISRAFSVFIAVCAGIALVVSLFLLLVPELYRSIESLVRNMPRYANSFIEWITSLQRLDGDIGNIIENILTEVLDFLENWLRTDLLKQVNVMMTSVTTGVFNFFLTIFYILIGLVVSVYLLFSKEGFAGQSKKLVYSVLGAKKGNFLIHITRKSHEIFGGFIIGKIVDSAIIGVLCFVSLTLLNMPYTLLVSVIVGVTNVIPFFGPYIGGVPCAVLILLVNPMQGLYFIIFIIVLQQVDGNIIGPKILGDSTGLSPFWIVVAILVGGGLFGFAGMVMGVPTLAVVFYLCSLFMDRKLEERKLPVDTDAYDNLSYIDEETGEQVYMKTLADEILEKKQAKAKEEE